MAFLTSFIGYLICFLVAAGLAILGVFVGKFLRCRKDAKLNAEHIDNKE